MNQPWSLVTIQRAGFVHAAVAVGDELFVPECLRGLGGVLDVVQEWERLSGPLRALDPRAGERVTTARLLSPLLYPRKVLCSGPNFHDHLKEMGESGLGEEWTGYFFLKPPTTTIIGPEDPIVVSGRAEDQVDWEGELAVVIGRGGRDIPAAHASRHIAGYTVANDISLRGPHHRRTPAAPFAWDWLASKGADSSLPVGPGLVPSWQVPDPQGLRIQTRVNGTLMQDGTTADMILDIGTLVAHASALVTLEPGDLIATGTPAGVGAARGVFLRPGDTVEVSIPRIGALRNRVRARNEG